MKRRQNFRVNKESYKVEIYELWVTIEAGKPKRQAEILGGT